MLGVWSIWGRGPSCEARQRDGEETRRPSCDTRMQNLPSGLPRIRLLKGGSTDLALQDPKPGNSRTPYKMVVMGDLWVDDGDQHSTLVRVAERIVKGELDTLLHESHFRVNEEDGSSGAGFSTYIDSISFVSRTDLN